MDNNCNNGVSLSMKQKMCTCESNDVQSPLQVVDSKSANKTRQALYDIDFTISPCLGVEFIVEFPKSVRSDGSIDENVVFICDLCAIEIQYLTLAKHVLSDGHRINYLTLSYVEVAMKLKKIWCTNSQSEYENMVTQCCMKVQQLEGSPKTIRVVNDVYMSDIHMNNTRRPGVPYYSVTKPQVLSSSPQTSLTFDLEPQQFPSVQQSTASCEVSNCNLETSNVSSSYERLMQKLHKDFSQSKSGKETVKSANQPNLTLNTPLMDPAVDNSNRNSEYKRPWMEPCDPSSRPHSNEKKPRSDSMTSTRKSGSAMGSFLEILKNTRLKTKEDARLATQIISTLSQALVEFRSSKISTQRTDHMPSLRISKSVMGSLLEILKYTHIKNKDDAALATQIISILSQALVEFRSSETSTSNGTQRKSASQEMTFDTNHIKSLFDQGFVSASDDFVDIVKQNEPLMALLNKIKNS